VGGVPLLAGALFALGGAAAERLAAVWPADEASRRAIGWRTAALGAGAGLAGGAIVWRSTLEPWATAVILLLLGLLVVLTATDLEQRRLPHLVLDPLIGVAALFAVVNPSVSLVDAGVGAALAVAFLGGVGLLVRGGVARGDLYLVAPLGLLLGWTGVIGAIFVAALLAALTSVVLLASRRVGMKSYIPFGPFLVIGTVVTLVRDPVLLGEVLTTAAGLR
jgi:prepilin signal peptidase PulO-like enzyme (type II secretory pathway)